MWAELERFASLPEWLLAAEDGARVRAALVDSTPEAAALTKVELERARNKSGGAWKVRYETSLGDGDGTLFLDGTLYPPEDSRLASATSTGEFPQPGWRAVLPGLGLIIGIEQPDAALPALPMLTDPERAREFLEQAIREGSESHRDIRIKEARPRVVREKLGSRYTIVYDLEYDTESQGRDWPERVAVKTYSTYKGKNAWDGMRVLWDSPMSSSRVVAIAEPLAFVPEHNVLVQGPIREELTLKDLLVQALRPGGETAMDRLRPLLGKTAHGLAELHNSGADFGDKLTIEDEMAEIREIADRLRAVPGVARAPEPMLKQLEDLAAEHPSDPLRPCHHSFRPAQVLVFGEDIGFIDFDGFCRAEPARDLSLFRATLKYIGMGEGLPAPAEELGDDFLKTRLEQMNELCGVFSNAYRERAQVTPERVALWEALDLLTYVLHCWTKLHPERLRGSMLMLKNHLTSAPLEMSG